HAVSDFNQAVQLDRRLARAYHQRGLANLRLGKIGTAQGDFSSALSIEPKNVRYLLDRGRCHYLRGNYREAIDDCARILRRDGGDREARRRGGVSYGGTGANDGRAILDLTEVVKAGRADAEVLAARGEALLERKRPDEAFADAAEALQREPACAAALAVR